VCGGYVEDHRYVTHRYTVESDGGRARDAATAAELRSFVALLADEPADDDGNVRVGAQNLADLLTWLIRAADRLEGKTP
jgi:hypothetical protein